MIPGFRFEALPTITDEGWLCQSQLAIPEQGSPSVLCVWLHGETQGATPMYEPECTFPAIVNNFKESGMVDPIGSVAFMIPSLLPSGPAEPDFILAWAVRYKGGRGAWAHTCSEARSFREKFLDVVCQCKLQLRCERVFMMGYSMGGLGALLLTATRPHLVNLCVAAAAFVPGTQTLATDVFGVPAELRYRAWQLCAGWIKHISCTLGHCTQTRLLVVHSPADGVSDFSDMAALVQQVIFQGGRAHVVAVPPGLENTDSNGLSNSGHGYLLCTFRGPSSFTSLVYNSMRDLELHNEVAA